MSFTLILVVGFIVGLYLFNQEFSKSTQLAAEKTILVPKETSLITIANKLESIGAIDRAWLFRIGVQINRKQSQLKAGEYAIAPNSSMKDIMDLMVSGKSIMHRITFAEGLTSQMIVERLNENDVLLGEITEIPPEGSLLPETYVFTRGETRANIVRQMKRAHDKALAEIWANRDPSVPVKTPEELVTLASIVEKETGVADERAMVAGVFVNRLNKGMKLQSDPTIIYGLVGGQGKLGRGILKSEILSDTPYNTYVIPALPIGPIANPGLESMRAVAKPATHDYIFFVADGTGGHAFAVTLDEHNANVAKWREIEANKAAGTPPSP